MNVGNLKVALIKRGMSVSDLAKKIGMTSQQVSQRTWRKKFINVKFMHDIAKALDLSMRETYDIFFL